MEKKKILICDDDEGVRESFNLVLEKDYQLSFATHVDGALKMVRVAMPDLVIMNIKMPRKSGLEGLKELRRLNPNIRVIMVTGYRSVEFATEAAKLGASDYITKPFEPEELKRVIQKILR